jgi:hypothetical protein
MRTRLARSAAAVLLLTTMALTACGGGTEGALSDGGDGDSSSKSFEDAMVEYAGCMREHGVDMPDPQFESSGGGNAVTFGVPVGAAAIDGDGGPGDATFKEAAEACASILESVRREMPKLSPEEEAKMRDDALKFAQCMREHGVDMPDPQFDSAGSGPMIIQGGGADSESRTPLDVDKFNEAAEACEGEGIGGRFRVAAADGESTDGAVGGVRIGTSGSAK